MVEIFRKSPNVQAEPGKSKLIQNDGRGINFYFLISPIDLCQKGRDYVRGGLTTAINSSITTLTVFKADNYRILIEFQSEKIIFLPGESFLDVKVSDVCLIIQAQLQCHLEQHLDHGRILTTFLQYPKRNSEKEKSK